MEHSSPKNVPEIHASKDRVSRTSSSHRFFRISCIYVSRSIYLRIHAIPLERNHKYVTLQIITEAKGLRSLGINQMPPLHLQYHHQVSSAVVAVSAASPPRTANLIVLRSSHYHFSDSLAIESGSGSSTKPGKGLTALLLFSVVPFLLFEFVLVLEGPGCAPCPYWLVIIWPPGSLATRWFWW